MGQVLQIAGALMVLAAFALAQRGALSSASRAYLLLNAVGASVLAVEGYLGRQWGFLLLEAAWALVAAGALRAALRPGSARRGRRPRGSTCDRPA